MELAPPAPLPLTAPAAVLRRLALLGGGSGNGVRCADDGAALR
jgi:hypothetical protein